MTEFATRGLLLGCGGACYCRCGSKRRRLGVELTSGCDGGMCRRRGTSRSVVQACWWWRGLQGRLWRGPEPKEEKKDEFLDGGGAAV